MIRAVGLLMILVLTAARGFTAESPRGEGGTPPLKMEELEVRGLREKPEVLYLPIHRGIDLPSPVRYDLFLEDMARPVFPQGISPGGRQTDKTVPARSAP
jgi:hypothetical protein